MKAISSLRGILSAEMRIPLALAFVELVLLMAFHGNYGYFRDELYYIACSDHLAFGYVDQPPLSIGILAVSRWLLGDSLHAIRFPAALAGACTVLLAAAMARRMGGGRSAMWLASLTVVAAHTLLGQGRYFSMNAFDILFWSLALYIVVRILAGETPKLWLLFGLVVGLGLLNKYSVGFLTVGLFGGLLLSAQRKQVAAKWFWLGAAAAFVLFLPHLIWEMVNGFPTLEFMRNASREKNVGLSPVEFAMGQLRDMNFLAAPLWLLGLSSFLFREEGKPYRALGWAYLIVFVVMVATNAKIYYLSPVYPVLFAGGAVAAERILARRSLRWVTPVYAGLLVVWSVLVLPFTLPVLPVEKLVQYQALLGITPRADERSSVGVLPQYYADQFGWEEMVATVAKVYATLTPEEQAECVIYVRNYGEAGAIDFFGKRYGLPPARCPHNNYWLWGPGERTGNVAIILGGRRGLQANLDDLKRSYREVELVATTECTYCMPYENGRQFFLCRGMSTTFQKLWPGERVYI